MQTEEFIESIAYCGLICRLCFRAHECSGCKSSVNLCEHQSADEGCYQKVCCDKNGYDGCWECPQLVECTEGIYFLGDMSKIKAFALCIQQDGLPTFANYVLHNEQQGLSVEKGKDYDGLPISLVINKLRSGGNK